MAMKSNRQQHSFCMRAPRQGHSGLHIAEISDKQCRTMRNPPRHSTCSHRLLVGLRAYASSVQVPGCRNRQARRQRLSRHGLPPTACQSTVEVDVAVVGGGIIGLWVALQLLHHPTQPLVALIERELPCSGATGAGQGYIWLSHRVPNSPAWSVAERSKQLWQTMVQHPHRQKGTGINLGNPADIEWQENGSMLLAVTAKEAQALHDRAAPLHDMGIKAVFYDHEAVKQVEPALVLPAEGGALLVETDAQLSGRRAAEVLLAKCHEASEGSNRFQAFMHEPIQSLELSPQTNAVTAVSTASRRVEARKGVVVAAGAWSGDLLSSSLKDDRWRHVFKPRRGHLLEVQAPPSMPPLQHGLMELGYTQHVNTSVEDTGADIAFTATPSMAGTCLVGSAREFSGWNVTPQQDIQDAIMQRAVQFLPGLAKHDHAGDDVRVGLRPYALGGLPFIGPVDGVPGLFVAAGHEGAGLTMAPATAELVVQHLMGEQLGLGAHAEPFLPSNLQGCRQVPHFVTDGHDGNGYC